MNVFILAAGLGSRLKPLTNKYPKPCIPFLNVPMGLYAFRYLQPVPVDVCVANTFHLPDQIKKLYKNQAYYKKEIFFSDEKEKILGSAGGLKKASRFFKDNDTILMMNADEVFFTEQNDFLEQAYQQHLKNKNLATLVVTAHPEAGKKFGAIWTESNRVFEIGKTSSQSHLQAWHYIGIIFLNKKVLSLIPDDQETNIFYDILNHQLVKNSVEIFKINCRWYETGNGSDYLNATEDALKNLDKKTLDFIQKYDPSELVTTKTAISLISKSTEVPCDWLDGFSVISKSTDLKTVSSKQKIKDSVLFENEVLNAEYFKI